METQDPHAELLAKLPNQAPQRMFPRNMIDEMDVNVNRLGVGNRMMVFPMLDAGWVLRVPLKSEKKLVEETGASENVVDMASHSRSNITHRELRDFELMTVYLGGFIPTTTPFPGLDLEGTFRYYAKQKRIKIASHLSKLHLDEINLAEYARIVKFIKAVRKLVKYKHLIPDIGGANNVVLGQRVTGVLPDPEKRLKPFSSVGLLDEDLLEVVDERSVYLIDINNVQPVISNEQFDKMIDPTFNLPKFRDELSVFRRYYEPMKEINKLPKGWLVDGTIAAADLNLWQLKGLERAFITGISEDKRKRLGLTEKKHKQIAESVSDQSIYAPLQHEFRNAIIETIESE